MKGIAALVLTLFTASVAQARDISSVNKQSAFLTGDSWTFSYTETENTPFLFWTFAKTKKYDMVTTIERLHGNKMLVSLKDITLNTPAEERLVPVDWHREHIINGVMTTVNLATKFPLKIGKTWRITYTEDNPIPNYKNVAVEDDYKVVG